MRILVTGGTGFIGRALCNSLMSQGHQLTVLTRNGQRLRGLLGENVSPLMQLSDWSADMAFDAVINLAGEPIMARRWSDARKQALLDSRVALTEQLVERMAAARQTPAVLISGSAIGVYGDQGDTQLTEASVGGTGFSHDLCVQWESVARGAESLGVRVCLLRTGLVVGKNGGFLEKMLLPFRLGLGGRIGDGHQWMSWIHLADHVALTRYLLENPGLHGVFNATAPHPVTNAEFTRQLASVLKRPALFPVPAWLLTLIAGEMAELLLGSERVIPERALQAGFTFQFETLEPALRDVVLGSA